VVSRSVDDSGNGTAATQKMSTRDGTIGWSKSRGLAEAEAGRVSSEPGNVGEAGQARSGVQMLDRTNGIGFLT
jgi:hypothetical protein